MSDWSFGIDSISDCAVFHLGRGPPLVYRLAVVLHAAVGHDELLPMYALCLLGMAGSTNV